MSQQSGSRFRTLYWWKGSKDAMGHPLPFGRAESQVIWQGPSLDTDSQVVTNSLSSPVNAFGIQQNVTGASVDGLWWLWFQNTAQVIKGRLLWGRQNFKWAAHTTAPVNPTSVTSTWVDDANGRPIDVTSGDYILIFVTQAEGLAINQVLMVVREQGGEVYVPSPVKAPYQGDLLTASLPICGFGGGSKATFTQGSFVKRHSLDMMDLVYGGQTLDYSRIDAIPNLFTSTEEGSNLADSIVDPAQANVQLVTEATII